MGNASTVQQKRATLVLWPMLLSEPPGFTTQEKQQVDEQEGEGEELPPVHWGHGKDQAEGLWSTACSLKVFLGSDANLFQQVGCRNCAGFTNMLAARPPCPTLQRCTPAWHLRW